MGSFGGFFKGEKKKKKKGLSGNPISAAPTFTPPTIFKKGKEKY